MYEIKKIESSVQIKISNADESVKEALSLCMEGKCSCRTSEYEKLKEMNICEDAEKGLTVNLIPKENENLNLAEVENCIKTITEVPKKSKTFYGEEIKAKPYYPDLQDVLDYLFEESKKDGFL